MEKSGTMFSKKKFSKKGKRKTYPTILVNVYRSTDLVKINEVEGIKTCGFKYNVPNMAYIINKNKDRELEECYSVNGIIFKIEEKKAF